MAQSYSGLGQGYIKYLPNDLNGQLIIDCNVIVDPVLDDDGEPTFYYNIDTQLPGLLDTQFVGFSIDPLDTSMPLKATVNGLNFEMQSLDEEGKSYFLTLSGNLSAERQFYFSAMLDLDPEQLSRSRVKSSKPKQLKKPNAKAIKDAKSNLKKEIAEFLKSKKLKV